MSYRTVQTETPDTTALAPAAPGRVRRRLPLGVLAVGIALWSLLAAAWVATAVFDRLPHVEDDVAFLFQARTLASGRIVAPAPPEPTSFSIPFVIVRDGVWFGKYPPGYPAVLALGVVAGHPWLVNPIAGALAILLTYRAGQRTFGSGTGLLAALLLATSPFFLLQAGSFLSHTVALVLTMAFILLFMRACESGNVGPGIAAGLMIGLLFLSRPLTAFGIGLPFAVVAAIRMVWSTQGRRTAVALALGFLPCVALLLAYNDFTTGSPLRFGYELVWPFDRTGFGPDIGPNGHDLANGIFNVRYNLDALQHILFGWPRQLTLLPALLALFLAAIALIRQRRSRANRRHGWGPAEITLLLGAMSASLMLVHLLYWTPGQMYGPRYFFEATGALALLTARGITQAAAGLAWGLRWRRIPATSAQLLAYGSVLLIVTGLMVSSLTTVAPREFRTYTDWYDINGDGLRRVEAAGLTNAVVFIDTRRWTDYAPFFSQNEPTLDSPVVYAVERSPETNQRLMAHYPGREFYLYTGRRLFPLPAPEQE